MLTYTLYGDGIHDDTAAIQELIDTSVGELSLPAPKKLYLISKPLVIPSCFKLRLPRYAEIKLADGSNCFMLQNKAVQKPAKRLREFLAPAHKELWRFYDVLSPDAEDTCHDFEIEGGIWNFNNRGQDENPIYTEKYDERNYLGHIMFFYNVRSFRIANLTLKDPANYGVMIDMGSYFTVENIVFDYNLGNPIPINMDGIHLNGNCHFGVIRNLQGTCYDDLVALNAHEGSGGDITNIEIDGVFSEGTHSAVRLLTVHQRIEHITISNVFGTYYQYCVGFTKFYPLPATGHFDAIELKNIHASKAVRYEHLEQHLKNKAVQYPFIWFQPDTHVKNVRIDGLHRREYSNPIDTVRIDKTATIERMYINDFSLESNTQNPTVGIVNMGSIAKLYTVGVEESDIDNQGSIEQHVSL